MGAGIQEETLLYGLLPQRCWDELLGDVECQKALVAKLLGYLLILGSLTVKAPQISKILSAKSVAGLAPFSIYSDLVIYITNAVYHVVSGSPFSAYGEIMTILVQNTVIVVLLWCYMKDRPSALGITGLLAIFLGTTVGCAMLPAEHLVLLPYSNLPLIIVAKVPQIMINHENGHTGQLASITTILNFVGATVRILTTIQEVGWDLGLLSMHGLSSFLNGVLALQVLLYWNRTAKWAEAQANKKEA
ncbi:unnamed protein product [Pylaiella littoralis]